MRHTIFVPTTEMTDAPTGPFEAGERVTVRFAFENWLAPSRYTLTPASGPAAAASAPTTRIGRGDDLAALIVAGAALTGGVVDLPLELEVERA